MHLFLLKITYIALIPFQMYFLPTTLNFMLSGDKEDGHGKPQLKVHYKTNNSAKMILFSRYSS